MSKLKQLFPNKNSAADPEVRNYEGAPAFAMTLEEQTLSLLLTGTLENTFYATGEDIRDTAIQVFKTIMDKNPLGFGKAIIYARTEGFMRTMPILALVVLSTHSDKSPFYAAFPKVIRNVGDLQDFVKIVHSGQIRSMGRSIKRAINNWLAGVEDYGIIKYGSDSQDFALRDIYRLSRPKLTGNANLRARYVVHSTMEDRKWDDSYLANLDRIATYEEFKRVGTDEDLAVKLIYEGQLPYEVITAIAPATKRVWEAMLRTALYFNTIRNLNNYEKYGVFDDRENVLFAAEKIANREAVSKSMLFPFRFLAALNSFKGNRPLIQSALSNAVEYSLDNMPNVGDRVLIANDVSGSMSHSISEKSDLSCANVASLLAAAAFKKANEGQIISFDTDIYPRKVSKRDSMLTIARNIVGHGGGTNLALPILALTESSEKVDTAIFITDSESWVDCLHGENVGGSWFEYRNYSTFGALEAIRKYKKTVNPDLKCFFIQVMPYAHRVVPVDEPNTFYLYGWNDNVVKYIGLVQQGLKSQVQQVFG